MTRFGCEREVEDGRRHFEECFMNSVFGEFALQNVSW